MLATLRLDFIICTKRRCIVLYHNEALKLRNAGTTLSQHITNQRHILVDSKAITAIQKLCHICRHTGIISTSIPVHVLTIVPVLDWGYGQTFLLLSSFLLCTAQIQFTELLVLPCSPK